MLFVHVSFSQNESNNWYFGLNAGLDFNSPSPIALTDGMVNSHGGSSTMSDSNGNLLFYSNGMTVWDKNHNVMTNGTGLLGHASSTQSSIIIPHPGTTDSYYIFTNDAYTGNNGLSYSEIDMSAVGGLGEVTAIKNVQLISPTTEKLTAVLHTNEIDYWVITHERGTNAFYAFLVSASGVGTAVVSQVGVVHGGTNLNSDVSIGQMKVSPDGTKIALATSANNNTFEIFDFNAASGIVSNPVTLSSPDYSNPYGVEFSADGTKLYCSTTNNNKVYQINMQAGSASAIIASATLIATSSSSNIGALQLGPDSKIYLARNLSFYLGVINNPNASGLNCNYIDEGVSLDTKRSRRGLPNFIQSYFNNPRFTYFNLCFGDSTFFFISDLNGVNSVEWDFGDPSSGSENTSVLTNPYHIFTAPGTFQVQLIRYFATYSDTVVQAVNIHSLPVIDLGSQLILLCENSDTILTASGGFESYLWQNGSVTSSITVSLPGNYSVTVTDDFGCTNSDDIDIETLSPPDIDLGNDTTICEEDNLMLNVESDYATYLWSSGSVQPYQSVHLPGIYYVTVSNDCGEVVDSITIANYPSLSFDLGEDISLCIGDTAILDPGDLGSSYLWSNGSSEQSIQITTGGMYSLEAFYANTSCAVASDSVLVTVVNIPTVSVSLDTLICEGDNAIFEAYGNLVTDYIWSNGATSSLITVSTEGMYYVTASNVCASVIDSVFLGVQDLPNVSIGNDTAIYNDESVQLEATFVSYWSYLWSPEYEISETSIYNPVVTPQETTSYTLEVEDTLGCTNSASITISVSERPLPEIVIYNTFSPNGDGVNDYWVIENIDKYPNCTLDIYNRNGNKVFSASNYQNNWDGKFHNKDLPAHTYYYILNTGETEKGILHGNVTIIR